MIDQYILIFIFQTVETDGATNADAFYIERRVYLIVTNRGQSGRSLTKSRLYAVDKNGTLTVVSSMPASLKSMFCI